MHVNTIVKIKIANRSHGVMDAGFRSRLNEIITSLHQFEEKKQRARANNTMLWAEWKKAI